MFMVLCKCKCKYEKNRKVSNSVFYTLSGKIICIILYEVGLTDGVGDVGSMK